MKKRILLGIFHIFSFMVSVCPLVIVFIRNFDKYTESFGGGIKLTVGGIIIAVLLFFKALGKLKLPNAITGYLTVFLLSYLLAAVLVDIILLSGMALLGEALDVIFIRPIIKKLRSDILVGKTARATAKEIKAVLDDYGIGRV